MKKYLMKMLLLSAVAATAIVQARPLTKGQDYDEKAITLKEGTVLEIAGQVTTINAQSGNTSSVILYIDGIEVRRAGGDQANSMVRHTLSTPGNHNLKIVCDSTKSDAESCLLKLNKVEREIY